MQNRLYRSETDNEIAGVCGGLGEYLGIDSTIIRLIWIISVFAFGTGVFIYIIAAILLPEKEEIIKGVNLEKNENGIYEQQNTSSNKNFNEENNRKLTAYALMIIGFLLLIKRFGLFVSLNFRFLFPFLLIGAGIMILVDSVKKK